VDISFATSALEKVCNDDRAAKRALGADGAKKLRRRLDDLAAAADLSVMRNLPGRSHELKKDLAGRLAVDLDGGRRLVFEPAHDPIPRKDDGGLDWSRVTAVRVTAIGDYHD
jgi:plasmid maintenance system killer protein